MRDMGYRILADGQTTSNDTWLTGRNNNDLIIGPSGAGKARGYVLPNILQGNESMIITDTKGTLHGQAGHILERQGYDVQVIDLTDCLASPWGYNPLEFIRYDAMRDKYSEQDILAVSMALVPEELCGDDPFWHRAARMILECLVGYTLDCLPEDEHNLCSVVRLFQAMGSGQFDHLMKELCEIAPGSFAATRYELFRSMVRADKMYSSVQGILAQKLGALTFDGTAALFTQAQQIDFHALGRRKTAVFLNISDTDHALDCLAGLFYAQALHILSDEADHSPGHRLAVPVRLILDDFAAGAPIEEFDKITSVIRSRGISVSIILQSLSQLEVLYGHTKAMTIVNSCDQLLYLGGQDVETARFISVKANKSVNTVLNMPLSDAWLFVRGADAPASAQISAGEPPALQRVPSEALYDSPGEGGGCRAAAGRTADCVDRKLSQSPPISGQIKANSHYPPSFGLFLSRKTMTFPFLSPLLAQFKPRSGLIFFIRGPEKSAIPRLKMGQQSPQSVKSLCGDIFLPPHRGAVSRQLIPKRPINGPAPACLRWP